MADGVKNAKKLVMVFGTNKEKNVCLSVDNPKSSLNETSKYLCSMFSTSHLYVIASTIVSKSFKLEIKY